MLFGDWEVSVFGTVTTTLSLGAAFLSKSLNLLALGDRYATNLGLQIKRARLGVVVTTGLLTAIVTSFCGPIIFLGVAVPHLAKLLSRTTALLCNLVARLPGVEQEMPINSVTAFVGAPVVIWVIWKRKVHG